jgi:hypothetical protein
MGKNRSAPRVLGPVEVERLDWSKRGFGPSAAGAMLVLVWFDREGDVCIEPWDEPCALWTGLICYRGPHFEVGTRDSKDESRGEDVKTLKLAPTMDEALLVLQGETRRLTAARGQPVRAAVTAATAAIEERLLVMVKTLCD